MTRSRTLLVGITAGALLLSLAAPSAAFADPVPVYSNAVGDASISVSRDGTSLDFIVTNLGDTPTTFGLAADLETKGILQDLWQSPFDGLASAAQVTVDGGGSADVSAPFWPGSEVEIYRGIETPTPELIGSFTTAGHHVRTVFGPSTDDGVTLEIGPAITWSAAPVVAGGGIEVTATSLDYTDLVGGAVAAYLDADASIDWAGDELVGTQGDSQYLLGTASVSPDGSYDLKGGLVPAGTPDGSYQVILKSAAGFDVHYSTTTMDVVDGTPAAVTGVAPTLTGAAKVGGTLIASTAGWAPSDVQFLYQWSADGVPIPGATTASYPVGPGDIGTKLSVAVTVWGPGYAPLTLTSPQTATIKEPKDFTATTVPVITGSPAVGQKLQVTEDAWTPGASFSYQWQVGGVNVGDGSRSYVPTPADAGKLVQVLVTGTKVGYNSQSVPSAVQGPVALGTITIPANRPTVTGQEKVGGTLNVNTGNWSPTPDAFSVEWTAGGITIPGDGLSIVVPAWADGLNVTAQVSATLVGYNLATATPYTDPTTIVDGVFNPKGDLTVSGALAVGQTLTADPGTWSPHPNFAYTWSVAGVAQPGSGSTFVIPSSAAGKKITVGVTASLSGYKSVTKSTAVGKVP